MTASQPPLKAPFPWFGGKSRAAGLIWPRFGDVPNYVEPFAGSLAVLLSRPTPPRVETVNDRDCYLSNFWRAVQADPEAVAAAADYPVNEADLHARHRWLVTTGRERIERLMSDPDHYDVQVAGWWVWGLCQWIGDGWCGVGADWKQTPHLADAGRGVHRALPGRKLPAMHGRGGKGVHGASLQLPSLGGSRGASGRGVHGSGAKRLELVDWFADLAQRLRRVRVACGDWSRVLGPSVTTGIGVTGVLLDPPYLGEEEVYGGAQPVALAVRDWALQHGDDPKLRIALCGYAGDYEMPASWACVPWKAKGGYGGQSRQHDNPNARRERIWFSPHCLRPAQQLNLLEAA